MDPISATIIVMSRNGQPMTVEQADAAIGQACQAMGIAIEGNEWIRVNADGTEHEFSGEIHDWNGPVANHETAEAFITITDDDMDDGMDDDRE